MVPGGSTTPYTNGTTPKGESEFPSKLEIYERLGNGETHCSSTFPKKV
jgi:hypothetical protein